MCGRGILKGIRPCIWRLRGVQMEVVSLLLKDWPDGVMAIARNRRADTSLHVEALRGRTVVRILVERWPEGTRIFNCMREFPLHFAVGAGETDMIRLLVESWPGGTKEKDTCGHTPLHRAAASGATEAVRLLVECWPEGKDALSGDRETPLAIFEEYAERELSAGTVVEREEIFALLGGENNEEPPGTCRCH
jgi:hypothetical protein